MVRMDDISQFFQKKESPGILQILRVYHHGKHHLALEYEKDGVLPSISTQVNRQAS